MDTVSKEKRSKIMSAIHSRDTLPEVVVRKMLWANGYRFRVCDCMLTNFHLPQSTLLMMVSALAGRERILCAYALAARANYLFFSYGDCMLIV